MIVTPRSAPSKLFFCDPGASCPTIVEASQNKAEVRKDTNVAQVKGRIRISSSLRQPDRVEG
jgi:hypothetical protein